MNTTIEVPTDHAAYDQLVRLKATQIASSLSGSQVAYVFKREDAELPVVAFRLERPATRYQKMDFLNTVTSNGQVLGIYEGVDQDEVRALSESTRSSLNKLLETQNVPGVVELTGLGALQMPLIDALLRSRR